MNTANIYSDSFELEKIKDYIKEIRTSFDSSILGLKLSMSEKKKTILQKYSDIKIDLKQSTQTNIEYVSQMVDVILAVDPIKKFQEVTENISETMKSTFNEILESLYNILAIEESNSIIENLTHTLEDIFFNDSLRDKEFLKLLWKENLTNDEINTFLDSATNKTISSKEWESILESKVRNWSLWITKSNHITQRIKILSTLSYYSLQTCLRVGIDTGLFIQNVMKFFPQKRDEVKEFATNFKLSWWLALTELSSGSDLFTGVTTTYIKNSDGTYSIQWLKHLQWLTNEATHWIVFAREEWWKWIKLFYLDTRKSWVDVKMIKEYKMSWLKSITYWVNQIRATVWEDCVFTPLKWDKKSTLRSLKWSLIDSRTQFTAMWAGHLKRIYKESYYLTHLRDISWWKMIKNECVQEKMAYIEAYKNIVDNINKYEKHINLDLQANNKDLEALSIVCKTIWTEYMVKGWLKARDLQGWRWFTESNIVRWSTEDAWPYTRFEGVNEMLYSQLAHKYSKNNIYDELTNETKDILKTNNIDMKFLEDSTLTKENIWQIYARIYTINILNEIKVKTKNCFTILIEEIKQILILKERDTLKLSKLWL